MRRDYTDAWRTRARPRPAGCPAGPRRDVRAREAVPRPIRRGDRVGLTGADLDDEPAARRRGARSGVGNERADDVEAVLARRTAQRPARSRGRPAAASHGRVSGTYGGLRHDEVRRRQARREQRRFDELDARSAPSARALRRATSSASREVSVATTARRGHSSASVIAMQPLPVPTSTITGPAGPAGRGARSSSASSIDAARSPAGG